MTDKKREIHLTIRSKIENILGELNELLDIYEENDIELSNSFVKHFQNSDSLEDYIYQVTSSLEDETELLKNK